MRQNKTAFNLSGFAAKYMLHTASSFLTWLRLASLIFAEQVSPRYALPQRTNRQCVWTAHNAAYAESIKHEKAGEFLLTLHVNSGALPPGKNHDFPWLSSVFKAVDCRPYVGVLQLFQRIVVVTRYERELPPLHRCNLLANLACFKKQNQSSSTPR